MIKRLNQRQQKFLSGLSIIIPPLAVLLIISIAFSSGGLYPFGDKSIAWCDMNQQALPLLIDFRDALLNGEGILSSAKNAGGMNFFGVFFFNLSSPFSFLALLVEKQDMLLFMNVLVALKMATAAFTAALYFRICHKNFSVSIGYIFSIMYALCGYGMLFFQTLAWLDVMYLFPILMIGFDRLIKHDKPLCYIISLALTLVAHFYLTYMVAVFLVLWFGVLVVSGEIKSKKTILTFCVSSVLSALLSAVVWLPALKQYLSSGRGESILETLASSGFMTSTNTVLPLLLCTAALTIVFFDTILHYSRATRFLKCRFWIFVLTLIPFFIEPINKMWHTGNYMAFPARFGFITVFSGLILAVELRQFKSTLNEENAKISPLHKTVAILLGVVAVVVYGIFSVTYFNNNREILDQYVTTLWGNYDSFIGVFTVFVIAVVAFGIIWVINSRKIINNRIFALLAAFFVVAECIFSINVYMVAVTDKNTQDAAYRSLYSLENTDKGTEFYRVGTTSKICNVNDIGAMGYNNLGHYTSLNSADYMTAMKRLGYSSYWMEVGQYGGTELTDALFSVKYHLGKGTEENVVQRNGVFYKKELEYWLPLGITVSDLPTDFQSLERADIQQELYEKVFGKSDSIIQKYNPLNEGDIIYRNGRYFTLSTTKRVDYSIYVSGNQTLYFDCFDKISNDVNEKVNDTLDVYVNGKRVSAEYPSKSHNGLLNLGKYSHETVSVTLVFNKRLDCSSFGVFGLKTDLLESAIAETNGANMQFEKGKYSGTITTENPTNLLLMLPYDEGYTVKVNGKKVEYNFVLGDFMSIAVDGKCDIEITYTTPLFTAGLIVSLIGVIAIVIYLMLKQKGINDGKLQNFAHIAFNVIFAIVFAVIYIFPVAVNIFSF